MKHSIQYQRPILAQKGVKIYYAGNSEQWLSKEDRAKQAKQANAREAAIARQYFLNANPSIQNLAKGVYHWWNSVPMLGGQDESGRMLITGTAPTVGFNPKNLPSVVKGVGNTTKKARDVAKFGRNAVNYFKEGLRRGIERGFRGAAEQVKKVVQEQAQKRVQRAYNIAKQRAEAKAARDAAQVAKTNKQNILQAKKAGRQQGSAIQKKWDERKAIRQNSNSQGAIQGTTQNSQGRSAWGQLLKWSKAEPNASKFSFYGKPATYTMNTVKVAVPALTVLDVGSNLYSAGMNPNHKWAWGPQFNIPGTILKGYNNLVTNRSDSITNRNDSVTMQSQQIPNNVIIPDTTAADFDPYGANPINSAQVDAQWAEQIPNN